jgi:hypothetical protein
MIALPFNAGHILFQRVRQPHRWYWPSANSMKKSGSPPNSSITQYGMRNAPVDLILIELANLHFNFWVVKLRLFLKKVL